MEITILILNIIGSLGLFLYGMKLMSEAMQRMAGGGLRRRLRRMTATPLSQVVTTGAITATVQSSSAVTAMIVSLVNASAVTLREAIGMIFGANIGTTATAWIIAIFGFGMNLSMVSVPLVGLGFSLILIGRRGSYRSVGEIVIGLALLLLGISLLQGSMAGIADHTSLFRELTVYADQGYLSVLLFVVIGALLTALLQSSSATITLTIVMCQSGLLPLDAALGMIVGENIGTTLSANVAAIVAGSAAKRAALSHTVINVLGMIWIVPLILPIARGLEVLFAAWGLGNYEGVPFMLAIFHSTFNILNTLILVGFTPQIADLVCRMIPTGSSDNRKRLFALDSGLVATPELSIIQAHTEIANHSRRTLKMFRLVRSLASETDNEQFSATFERIEKYCQITTRVQGEIITYLSRLGSGGEQTAATTRMVHSMLRTVLHLELLANQNMEIARIVQRKRQANQWFSQELRDGLSMLFDQNEQAIYAMITTIENPTSESVAQSRELIDVIITTANALREQQIQESTEHNSEYIARAPFLEIVAHVQKMSETIERIITLQIED